MFDDPVILEPDGDTVLVTFPDVPEAVTFGADEQEALLQAVDAGRRFVEHTLQLAIQAALDAASHWVSARRLGEPESNRALFRLLTEDRVIDHELGETLAAMAGLQNILVHGYQPVNMDKLREILDHHLGDLDHFAAALHGAMQNRQPKNRQGDVRLALARVFLRQRAVLQG